MLLGWRLEVSVLGRLSDGEKGWDEKGYRVPVKISLVIHLSNLNTILTLISSYFYLDIYSQPQ